MSDLGSGNARHRPWLTCATASLILLCAAAIASAQSFDASNLHQPAELGSTWLIHGGDNLAYARPDFDDSQWTRFDPHTDIKTIFTNGHPDVIWYRLRVKVDPDQAGLALRECNLSSAFEIYVNGQRLITNGQVDPYVPRTFAANLVAPIPASQLATGMLVIAMRVHISPPEWYDQQPGYAPENLLIGQQSTLDAEDWLSIIGANLLDWFGRVTSIALGVVAIILFSTQRRQTPYLWIAAVALEDLFLFPEPLVSAFYNIPQYWAVLNVLIRVFSPFLFASLYFSFVGVRVGWRWRTFLILAGILNAYSGLQGLILPNFVRWQLAANLPFIILLSVVMPVILFVHSRRGNREAGILLIPVLLFSLYVYAEVGLGILFQIPARRDFALTWLNRIDRYPAGPFILSLNDFAGILSTLSLAIIMLLRSIRVSRRQAELEGELAAAQQVQQVLLPEQIETVPGFQVETVYQPAQQVGGDFFQVLPAGEGGLLVVVGDVAGKGLPAAMLVSVLVGAIRGVAEYTVDPAEMLGNLNERLVGRGGGSFSTALVAHVAASGQVTIANAGHLSPYLDGREVELTGALPLGVMSGAAYNTTDFYLAPGSRLTFYSDGVVEAQNQKGELFGFERAKAISTQPAAAIVEAAKVFGQEDDITVVTIERRAAVASAA